MNSKYPFHFSRAGSRRRRFPLAIALLLSLIASTPARAAERTWNGGAPISTGWTDAANWFRLDLPVAGDSLRFPAGALKPSNNNNFPAGTIFNRVTYAGAGYTVSGNRMGLTGGLLVSHGAGNTVLNLPINIEANQTFTVSLEGANLFLNGSVDLGQTRSALTFDGAGQTIVVGNISDDGVLFGGAGIRKNGPGTLYVLQNLTLGGSTVVNGGTLIMDGRMSNSAVTVNASATLRGTGKVGGLTVNSGGTVSPGQTSPDILDSLGDVALNAGSTFNMRLNGTSVGLNYDQLRVQGAVTLGGTLNATAGFVAAVGDTFTIIENDGTDDVVGTFAGLPERAILMLNGRPFQISYGRRLGGVFGQDDNNVTLEAVPALSVWDGGGGQNNSWSTPQNWVGDVLPFPGDDLEFVHTSGIELVTVNDFPAGRVVGAMSFAGDYHRLEGNQLAITRGIRMTQPGQVTLMAPLVLAASQTFRADLADSILRVDSIVELAGHDLSILTEAEGRISLDGVNGTGTVRKEGSGNAAVYLTPLTASIIVNNGTLLGGDLVGPVIVNTGAVFSARSMYDVDVRGGKLGLGSPTFLWGKLRLLEGAAFEVSISYNTGSGAFIPTYLVVGGSMGQVELDNCNLNVIMDFVFYPNRKFDIIRGPSSSSSHFSGTFNGLPDGSRFAVGGNDLTIDYEHAPEATIWMALTVDAPFIWDGGGNGNLWSTASNWVAELAPLPGKHLVFPPNITKLGAINDFPEGTIFPSLTFGAASCAIAGNPFRTARLINDYLSGETIIYPDLVVMGQPFPCMVANASRLLLEGRLIEDSFSMTRVLEKTGTGILRFGGTGPNSLTRVEVREGELELAKPPGTDAISRSVEIGDGTNTAQVTLLDDHQLADGVEVEVHAHARFELNGNTDSIGQLKGQGTLSFNGLSLPARSGRLTVNWPVLSVFSGAIIGNGGLTVGPASSGGLELSGTNTFSGMTILDGGRLRVDGVQTNSPIRLNGGVLTGRGWVGTITGNLGVIVQPGFSGAVFQNKLHSRDVVFNSATTFQPFLTSVDPGLENSQLQVSGAVNLGGSTLDIELLFAPSPGRSFVIIDNDGADAVAGTFAGLPEGAFFGGNGLPFRISYVGGTGNDVVVTRVAAPASMLNSITVLSNGQMRIEGLGISGVVYPIQAASNLNPVIIWTPVGNGTGNANGIFQYLDTSASNRPMRFYRAVSP